MERLPSSRRAFRILGSVAAALVLAIGTATPALADPAVPTEYESRVTGIDPAVDAISVEVVGGDAFIEITVDPGHVVEIPGYFGEPYVSIDADGIVSVNLLAPTRFVNEDRFGETSIPPEATADATPQWQVEGREGIYAWHDHRTHWMNPSQPPGIVGDKVQEIFAWEIPLTVDGSEHYVTGTLEWHPGVSPIAPLLLGLIPLGALAWRRPDRIRLAALLAAVAAGVAGILSFAQWLATPAIARTFPWSIAPPLFALALLLWAAVAARNRPVSAVQAIVVAAVALAVFVFSALDVFTRPLLPSVVPDAIERVATAAVGWIAIACGVVAVARLLALTGSTQETADVS